MGGTAGVDSLVPDCSGAGVFLFSNSKLRSWWQWRMAGGDGHVLLFADSV
jgi:hypothetical protein